MSITIYIIVLVLLLWFLKRSARKGIKHIVCQRSFSCKEAVEGDEGELVEVVRNSGPHIIPWLCLESNIGTGLQLGRKSGKNASDDTHYRSCFTLMPYQQVCRRHYVKFNRRGVYDLGNSAISVGSLRGTNWFYKDLNQHTQITVYPRLLNEEDIPFPMNQVLGELVTKNRLQQDPFMIRGIRPYQPGDLIRDIHWQASARTEEIQVAVHDSTVYPRMLVLINAQHADNQWDNYISDKIADRLEENIRLAASMCVYGINNGLEVGFAANMPQEQSSESTILMPAGGMDQKDSLMHSFACLQNCCSEKFIALMQKLKTCRDLDIVVLSFYNSDSIQNAIRELEQLGNRVTFCLTEGGTL